MGELQAAPGWAHMPPAAMHTCASWSHEVEQQVLPVVQAPPFAVHVLGPGASTIGIGASAVTLPPLDPPHAEATAKKPDRNAIRLKAMGSSVERAPLRIMRPSPHYRM
ncbi:MAG TPA: hypothetical protein VKE22_00135 [Haliangiales bacterium]|nr:hypothetical protein [Haliangiales bacterium]